VFASRQLRGCHAQLTKLVRVPWRKLNGFVLRERIFYRKVSLCNKAIRRDAMFRDMHNAFQCLGYDGDVDSSGSEVSEVASLSP
jgi:hypothetical protein